MSNDNTCCFCFQDIENNQSTTSLQCGHTFHSICYRQDHSKTCPMCRGDKIVKETKFYRTTIKQYNDDEYVWLFGSFFNIKPTGRKNYITYNMNGNKLTSGYFWRLFDDQISSELEEQYKKYIENKKNNSIKIEIGAVTYDVLYNNSTPKKSPSNNNKTSDDDSDDSCSCSNSDSDSDSDCCSDCNNNDGYFVHDNKLECTDPNIQMCIQSNTRKRHRPVLRIKWSDAVKHLIVVGVHDSSFFNSIKLYTDNKKYYFFDMKTQQKINSFDNNKKHKIRINKIKYRIDNNYVYDDKDNIIYVVEKYKDQEICNY